MISSSLSVRAQTRATNAWSQYQANSIKARIVETELLDATPETREKLLEESAEFRARQGPIKRLAEKEEKQAEELGLDVSAKIRTRNGMTYAMVATQAAIGICSIAVVSKRHTAFILALAVSLLGIGLTIYTLFV